MQTKVFRFSRQEQGEGDSLLGAVLGSYRILALIAEGGMGRVYRGRHVWLNRDVAIKVLKPALANRPALVQRFLEEARAAHRIGHPNLVDVFDFDEARGARPPLVFMVMEYLRGFDLATRLRVRGSLAPIEAVAVADAIADALAAAHRCGIVHRDLKAENIFIVRRDDGTGRVKLLDFGIALRLGPGGAARQTRPGDRVGTPGCMAPEQLAGQALDERADIYTLGLTLYQMLSGLLPPLGDLMSPSGEIGEVGSRTTGEGFAGRSHSSLGICALGGASLPAELEQTVRRCIEPQPEARFPSARALQAALRASVGAPSERELGRALDRLVARDRLAAAKAPAVLASGEVAAFLDASLAWGAHSVLSNGPAVSDAEVPTPSAVADLRAAAWRTAFARRWRLALSGLGLLALLLGGTASQCRGLIDAAAGDPGDRQLLGAEAATPAESPAGQERAASPVVEPPRTELRCFKPPSQRAGGGAVENEPQQ